MEILTLMHLHRMLRGLYCAKQFLLLRKKNPSRKNYYCYIISKQEHCCLFATSGVIKDVALRLNQSHYWIPCTEGGSAERARRHQGICSGFSQNMPSRKLFFIKASSLERMSKACGLSAHSPSSAANDAKQSAVAKNSKISQS